MNKAVKISLFLLFLLCGAVGCGKQTKINELISQGNEAYKSEDYDAAIEAFTSALELSTEQELVYNNRGMAYMNQGLYSKAIADFSSAIALNNQEDVYYYNRGLAYSAQNQWAEAEQDFTDALSLRTEIAYYIGRGDARKALEKNEAAIEDYGAALEIEPDNMLALNNRGALYFAIGEYAKAVEDYTSALQQPEELAEEDQITLYWNRAEANRRIEAYEAAAADYTTYLEKSGTEDAAALTGLVQCQVAEELFEDAITTYTRLLALDPDNMTAYQGRADAYYQLEQYSEAIEDYTVILTAQEDALSYALRGACYYQLGEYASALEDLTTSISLNDSYAWAYYMRSNVYKATSEYKAAQTDLEKAIELEKTTEDTDAAAAEE